MKLSQKIAFVLLISVAIYHGKVVKFYLQAYVSDKRLSSDATILQLWTDVSYKDTY